MSIMRELVFDWLINASLQIALFAIVAVGLSGFIAKASAKYRHSLYLAILALCLAAPILNTLWRTHPHANEMRSQQQPTSGRQDPDHAFWIWSLNSRAHPSLMLAAKGKTALLVLWQALFLYQLTRFSRGIYRVHRLRKGALPLSLNIVSTNTLEPPCRVLLLESPAIDDPVTIGAFHHAIILPSRVVPSLTEPDLAAILAHEYGHIQRKDFLVHLLCQLLALPVAWHPGTRYLMAKISQTRELACDEYAAVRLGKRLTYARTLVRLASLCLQAPRSNAIGLGIFDGDNLEERIMMLTEKRTKLSRAGLLGLALATTVLFTSSTVLARAVSLQETSASASSTKFTGTWHWMFKGRSFATMTLTQTGSQITGSATESKIALDDNGELSQADPSENRTPVPITRTRLEGAALHVTVGKDAHPMEFIVTLKDVNHAEIRPVGAPTNMKPIQAERAN